ncbi:LytR/AlgR family response regulator transcription factor [Halalkalibacter urbisdiaboli]|uniref:LytR/AlgR family response regulator transcription factor n=1 Tax=Halalkalibacter urbisdiaboli TaxID=1960589 RepID=UPI000B440867|nr:LytTR family DNA-binding domain-containing protein [Halalkalibacter urbisdiaboli]
MNFKIRTIIIDDEIHSRNELRHLLEQHNDIELVAEADSGEKALKLLYEHEVDLLFLDIDMPRMTGMELAELIAKGKHVPNIVFATAYPDYAAKAFRIKAIDYLLKPFEEQELRETLERVRAQIRLMKDQGEKEGSQQTEMKLTRLAVEDEGRIRYIQPQSILYLFRQERETVICTREHCYHVKTPLKEMKQKLQGYSFFQTHKSYLVNVAEIDELIPWFNGAYQIKMKGIEEEIPASRMYVKELRERLEL